MQKKKWNLWIDDIRNPKTFAGDWQEKELVWATSVSQAIYFCQLWGPPQFMSLDHDLGWDQSAQCSTTVPEFLWWLQKNYPDSPPDYRCHTANPIGEKNMVSFMESWKKSLE